jgi:hypothetical protein
VSGVLCLFGGACIAHSDSVGTLVWGPVAEAGAVVLGAGVVKSLMHMPAEDLGLSRSAPAICRCLRVLFQAAHIKILIASRCAMNSGFQLARSRR